VEYNTDKSNYPTDDIKNIPNNFKNTIDPAIEYLSL
jgi:hypothetical protein